ncbi:MAG: CPBP family intramembrane glutamic endopeptidase [Bacteroidota bacterium]
MTDHAELSEERLPLNTTLGSRFLSFSSFIFFALGGYILSNAISLFLVMGIFGISLLQMAALQQDPAGFDNAWLLLILIQVFAFTGAFLLTPIVYLRWIEHKPLASLNSNRQLSSRTLLAVALLVIAFIPFNDLVIQWNNSISLPKPLAPVEHWMQDMEEKAKILTQILTSFTSPFRLLVGLLVIAVMPAIGEELVFRGLLQNKLQSLTRNTHVSVWVAAILFSAIHLQFYGFIPRMLLGAMFGYLYAWSGSLWLPILAHFVNNSFTILMVYLYQQKLTEYDGENAALVSFPLALVSLAITIGLLYYIKTYYKTHRSAPDA